VVENSNQNLNPPQSPLVRGEDESAPSLIESVAECAPPLTAEGSPQRGGVPTGVLLAGARGGREGLGFLPYDCNLTALARSNRKAPTPAEQKIWYEVLSRRQFSSCKFLRQKPIDRFIVDFYCSTLRLVIEIDGDSHAGNPMYDIERTQTLQRYGLTVIRYSNQDVMHNISGVYDDLVKRIL
jgi:very-short-patch-repair endonuclease